MTKLLKVAFVECSSIQSHIIRFIEVKNVMEKKDFRENELSQCESGKVKMRAGCACGGGPVYEIATDVDGNILAFSEAYPNAPRLMKRIASYFRGGNKEEGDF